MQISCDITSGTRASWTLVSMGILKLIPTGVKDDYISSPFDVKDYCVPIPVEAKGDYSQRSLESYLSP